MKAYLKLCVLLSLAVYAFEGYPMPMPGEVIELPPEAFDERIEKPGKDKTQILLKDVYIDKNKQMSDYIDRVADDLDVYLSREKLTTEVNNSSVAIENTLFVYEGGGSQASTHFNLNLRLPNLEKKWQLNFTSYDQREEERGLDRRKFRTRPRDENYGASVIFFKQLGDIKTSFQPRLELRNPLEMSYVLTFESTAESGDTRFDPKLELFAQAEKGTGVFTSIPIWFFLDPVWTFLFIQEVEYQNSENKFSHNNGISFTQKISETSGINYTLAAQLNNREAYHLVQYGFAAAWDHLMFEDNLRYSVAPTWTFSKGENFHGIVGMKVTLDFIF